jgi:hypothetical protein
MLQELLTTSFASARGPNDQRQPLAKRSKATSAARGVSWLALSVCTGTLISHNNEALI